MMSCHAQCHPQPHHGRARQGTTTPGVPLGGTTTTPSGLCGAELQLPARSVAGGPPLSGVAGAASRLERGALSPGRAGPAERGPQPAPPPAAAGPAREALGRRPAERHGRVPGTGECCAGCPGAAHTFAGARPGPVGRVFLEGSPG
ncbi:cuticle collagen 2-like [Motacilla alba alba]|uniref:cuticle collagen 2-like n=1 Tax=Motacilla alba alba TaxID=1094192 RepID=UPI0018D59512|nr:cuticle collagen 2-like [Motacilla alba alba]